jgi:hypothetical protein
VEPIEVVDDDIETGPFHERQRSLGATFYEDMGWLWTRSFGDPEDVYWAVRRGSFSARVRAAARARRSVPGS